MRPIILFFAWAITVAGFAQGKYSEVGVTHLISIDGGFQGIGATAERRLSDRWIIDLSVGAGGGYEIYDAHFRYTWYLVQPAFQFAVTPRFIYNRLKRANKGRSLEMNSGNFVGMRLRYTTASVASHNPLRNTFLANLHWGMRKSLGGQWILTWHIGLGYAQDIEYEYKAWYPAFEIVFSYVL